MKCWFSLLLALGLITVACSESEKKAEEILGGNNKPAPKAFSVKGLYESDCIKNPLGGMRIVSLDSDGKDVVMETSNYQGTKCEDEVSQSELEGTFEDYGQSKVGSLVRLKIQLKGSAYTWRFYNMKVNKDKIRISEAFVDEEDANKNKMNILLKKVGK